MARRAKAGDPGSVDVATKELNPRDPRLRLFRNRPEISLLLNEFCDQAGPAGLMRRAKTRAGVAVKILVKQISMIRSLPLAHLFGLPVHVARLPPAPLSILRTV